jgi:uncharacterized coiled-coil DUF342 family protein
MSFESQIQQWVSLDNQLKQLNEKVKDLRDKRNNLEENITWMVVLLLHYPYFQIKSIINY